MNNLKQQLKSLIIEQYNCQWGEDIVDELTKMFREEIKEGFKHGQVYFTFTKEISSLRTTASYDSITSF